MFEWSTRIVRNRISMIMLTVVLAVGMIVGVPPKRTEAAVMLMGIPLVYHVILWALIACGIVVVTDYGGNPLEALKAGCGELYSLVVSIAERMSGKFPTTKLAAKIIREMELQKIEYDEDPEGYEKVYSTTWDGIERDIPYVSSKITKEDLVDSGLIKAVDEVLNEKYEESKSVYKGEVLEEVPELLGAQEMAAMYGKEGNACARRIMFKVEGEYTFGTYYLSQIGSMTVEDCYVMVGFMSTGAHVDLLNNRLYFSNTETPTQYRVLVYTEEGWTRDIDLVEPGAFPYRQHVYIAGIEEQLSIVKTDMDVYIDKKHTGVYFDVQDNIEEVYKFSGAKVIKTKTMKEIMETDLPEEIVIPLEEEDLIEVVSEGVNQGVKADDLYTLGGTVEKVLNVQDLVAAQESTASIVRTIADTITKAFTVSPEATYKLTGMKIPDLFILMAQVLFACIRLSFRVLGYVISLLDVEEDSSLIPANMAVGIDWAKNLELKQLNVKFYDIILTIVGVTLGLAVYKKIRRHYNV